MGFLSRLFKTGEPGLVHLPSGSFTVDKEGAMITSTLPQSFPSGHRDAISQQVMASFRAARRAHMPLNEIVIQYSAMKLLARELGEGAIVFLMPQSLNQQSAVNIKKSP